MKQNQMRIKLEMQACNYLVISVSRAYQMDLLSQFKIV